MKKSKLKAKRHQVKKSRRGNGPRSKVGTVMIGTKKRVKWRNK